jgi:hypothetical protein
MGQVVNSIAKSARSDWLSKAKSMKDSGASKADMHAEHSSLRQKAKASMRDAKALKKTAVNTYSNGS